MYLFGPFSLVWTRFCDTAMVGTRFRVSEWRFRSSARIMQAVERLTGGRAGVHPYQRLGPHVEIDSRGARRRIPAAALSSIITCYRFVLRVILIFRNVFDLWRIIPCQYLG
jgi:hypothetical protein